MRLGRAAACLVAILIAGCGKGREAAPRAHAAAAARDSAHPPARDSAPAASGQWCELADADVEAAIAAVARQRDADEYCEDRHYAVDDVDGDSLDDLAVTFDLEQASGEGDDESYLMIFLTGRGSRPPLLLEIDNTGNDFGARYPTDVSIDGQYVVVDFSLYLPGDPDCCPSGSSTVRFLVTRDRIVEQVPRGRRPQRTPGV